MKGSTIEQKEIRKQLNVLYRQKLDNKDRLVGIKIQRKISELRAKLNRADNTEDGVIGYYTPHLIGYCLHCEKSIPVGECFVEWRASVFCNSNHLDHYLIESGHKKRSRVEA